MKINHKIFLLILPLISFFYLSPEVYADNFTIQSPGTRTGSKHFYTCISYDESSLKIKKISEYRASSSYATSVKTKEVTQGTCVEPYIHIMYENSDATNYVYCSNKGNTFWGKNSYSKDYGYPNEHSQKLGYIIEAAWKNKEEKSEAVKWFNAQAAVWTYLAEQTSYKQLKHDGGDFDTSNVNETIRNIISIGLKNYKQAANNNISNSTDDSAEFAIDVEGEDNNLRFIPENDSCGQGGGNYTTRKITITNLTDHYITINLSINNSNVSAYYTDDNKIAGDISISAREKIEIKLKTSKKLDNPQITLTIDSTYSKKIQVRTPSTKRYTTPEKDNKTFQGILTYRINNEDKNNTYTHTDTRSFKQIGLTHKTCDDYNNDKEAKGSNTKDEAKYDAKICASNSESNPPKASDYTVKFAACKCQKLDLGDGKVVRILLKEGVGFRFGSLTPTAVYPGGSFKLNNDSSNGITTGYKSVITWEYADWVEDGNYPYYYNPDNLDDDNANKLAEEISEKIKDEVLNEEISLQFESKDSNDEKEQKSTVVPVTLSIENIPYDEEKKTFTLDYNNGIQLNDSYFSVDGEVKYEKDSIHTIEGGKEYYIPLHYLEKKFPFNITGTNLSALKGGNFWYYANCNVAVNTDNYLYDKENGIRYRSITVSKPFPKATKKSDLPFNWQEWYWESTSNQQRIKDSYKNYPSQPLYKITVDNEKMTKIRNITDSYNSWSNIKSNGSSKFVVEEDNYFNTRANDTSYCPIGMFSDTCDK